MNHNNFKRIVRNRDSLNAKRGNFWKEHQAFSFEERIRKANHWHWTSRTL